MEYLVPIIAVLVIGALVAGVVLWMGRRPGAGARPAGAAEAGPSGISAERAKFASGLLDEEGHREVYGHIATSRSLDAIRVYRGHTGRSLREAVMDVQALAAYPQVFTLPEQPSAAPREESTAPDAEAAETAADHRAPGQEGPAAAEPAAEDGAPDPDVAAGQGVGADPVDSLAADLTVPGDWTAEPASEDRPFEVEVMRGERVVHLSSHDLPPWLRDQLAAMVRDGNLETAAVQLSSHTELSVPEAFELLRRIRESREG